MLPLRGRRRRQARRIGNAGNDTGHSGPGLVVHNVAFALTGDHARTRKRVKRHVRAGIIDTRAPRETSSSDDSDKETESKPYHEWDGPSPSWIYSWAIKRPLHAMEPLALLQSNDRIDLHLNCGFIYNVDQVWTRKADKPRDRIPFYSSEVIRRLINKSKSLKITHAALLALLRDMVLDNPHPLFELSTTAEITYGMLRTVRYWDREPRPLDLLARLPPDFNYDAFLPDALTHFSGEIKSDFFNFFIDRYSDEGITPNVVTLAFGYCPPELVRKLLRTKIKLRPSMLRNAVLHGNRRTIHYFLNICPDPVLKEESVLRVLESIFKDHWYTSREKRILIARKPRVALNERTLVTLFDKPDSNKFVDFLSQAGVDIPLTSLTAEIAARLLNLESIHILKDKYGFQWNRKTVCAAASNEQHGDALWTSMMADISNDLLTDEMISNAATALLADSLEGILKRRPDYRWTEQVILTTLRTCPSKPKWWESPKEDTTLRKLELLLSHERSFEPEPELNFWAAVIATGHSQTLEILQLLTKHVKLPNLSDTLVIACFANSSAFEILGMFFARDPHYRLSEEALLAYFQFHRLISDLSYHPKYDDSYRNDDWKVFLEEEPLTRLILDHGSHLTLSSEMVAAAFHSDNLLNALLNLLPRSKPFRIPEASFLRGMSCFELSSRDYLPDDRKSWSVDICLQNNVDIEMTTAVLEKIVTSCPLETMERILSSDPSIEITKSMRQAAARTRAHIMLIVLAEKSNKTITYAELDAIFDKSLNPVRSICEVIGKAGWQVEAHPSAMALLCNNGRFEDAEKLFSTVSDTERDSFLEHAISAARDAISNETAVEMIAHFGLASLGDIFFESLPKPSSRKSRWLRWSRTRTSDEAILSATRFWDSVVSLGCHLSWDPKQVDAFLGAERRDVCMRVMKGGSGFPVNEETLLSAIKYCHEYNLIVAMFQQNPEMVVSKAHTEAVVDTKGTEVLDLLISRIPDFKVDSGLLKLAFTEPWYREYSRWDHWRDESCVEYLIDAAPPSSVTEEVLIQAANILPANWFSLLAVKAFRENFTFDVAMAAVSRYSSDKRLMTFLEKCPRFAERLDSQSVLTILKEHRGREILQDLDIDIDKMDIRVDQAYLKEALERFRYSDYGPASELMWLLPRAKGVKITDEMLALVWPEDTAIQLLLEHDPNITMGRHCLEKFWKSGQNGSTDSSIRFSKKLPACAFAIDSKVITTALDQFSGFRVGGQGEACLNIVLGPECRSHVCESALHELARRRRPIWFFRLLEKAKSEGARIQHFDQLVSAAEIGGSTDIINTCRGLRQASMDK